MTFNELESDTLLEALNLNEEEEFSIPLDISDIISICKDFNSLGYNIQNQVENILEVGVEESIRSGFVKQESLSHVKHFLKKICSNPYFGDAVSQSQDCIKLIIDYEDKFKKQQASIYN